MTAPLLVAVDRRGVATLTLNRPDRRNALSAALMDALTGAAQDLARDRGLRAVVLAGAGPAFCAGGDLDWMQANFAADRATRLAEGLRLARMFRALDALPQPVIARVQGLAWGGGVGLMCVADVAVAASDARFGLTEARLGLIPATIAPWVAARVGPGPARRLFLTARSFDAPEAQALGLAAAVCAPDDLDAAVAAELDAVLACAPSALARSKALLRALAPGPDDATLADIVRRLADAWEDPEAAEGVAAFRARRPAPWVPGA